MSDLPKHRALSRLREMERRLAAMSVAVVSARIGETRARVGRLQHLSQALSVKPGRVSGREIGSGGEYVARLLAGCITTAIQRDRYIDEEDDARTAFAVADARAQIARRQLSVAERADANAGEFRAALKMPIRTGLRCQQ